MTSSSSPRGRRSSAHFVSKVISPAIRGQNCPICLTQLRDRKAAILSICKHAYCTECIRKWSNYKRNCPLCNALFDAWFFNINLSSRSFYKQRLRPLGEDRRLSSRTETTHGGRQRIHHRLRDGLTTASSRTRALPWLRSFGRPGFSSSDDIAERKLEWRASIYDRHLQAVPLAQTHCFQQNITGNNGMKETILQRIEPWIRRELRAILGDPDPSVIVHVATSVFNESLCRNSTDPSVQLDVEDSFLSPLRPFLHNLTNMFWHELRCFAGSSFSMETYDAVIEYRQS